VRRERVEAADEPVVKVAQCLLAQPSRRPDGAEAEAAQARWIDPHDDRADA
jgi:hypothetical protein